jgi:hypothetical protein
MGSFAAIAGAETALTKEIDRHVFEIAELLRVSLRVYNLRDQHARPCGASARKIGDDTCLGNAIVRRSLSQIDADCLDLPSLQIRPRFSSS